MKENRYLFHWMIQQFNNKPKLFGFSHAKRNQITQMWYMVICHHPPRELLRLSNLQVLSLFMSYRFFFLRLHQFEEGPRPNLVRNGDFSDPLCSHLELSLSSAFSPSLSSKNLKNPDVCIWSWLWVWEVREEREDGLGGTARITKKWRVVAGQWRF